MRTLIGVDPALRLNGMAACFIMPDKEVEFKRYKRFLDFLKDSIFWKNLGNPVVIIEDSSLQNITFNNSTNRAILSKMSRNVGMNQAASRIAYEWIKKHDIEAYNISPEAKGKKFNKDVFMRVVASERLKFEPDFKPVKISQDEIDAFFLALMAKNYIKR